MSGARLGYLRWKTEWWAREFQRLKQATGLELNFDSVEPLLRMAKGLLSSRNAVAVAEFAQMCVQNVGRMRPPQGVVTSAAGRRQSSMTEPVP